jgi:isopentenyl diphosphate isomerase/L-lactate dehydrogenase-like FMN-dependent dehydrogenase
MLFVHQGEEGVHNVLELLKKELEMALQLSGCTKLSEIQRSMVTHALAYQSKL